MKLCSNWRIQIPNCPKKYSTKNVKRVVSFVHKRGKWKKNGWMFFENQIYLNYEPGIFFLFNRSSDRWTNVYSLNTKYTPNVNGSTSSVLFWPEERNEKEKGLFVFWLRLDGKHRVWVSISLCVIVYVSEYWLRFSSVPLRARIVNKTTHSWRWVSGFYHASDL